MLKKYKFYLKVLLLNFLSFYIKESFLSYNLIKVFFILNNNNRYLIIFLNVLTKVNNINNLLIILIII